MAVFKSARDDSFLLNCRFWENREEQQELVLFEAENISENYLLKVTLLKAIVKLSFKRERKVE